MPPDRSGIAAEGIAGMKQQPMLYLHERDMSEKLLYTAYLIVVGFGYLMALVYLEMSHAGNDDKPGLSVEDIAVTYYGNRSGTRIEGAMRTWMGDLLHHEDRVAITDWIYDGAPDEDYETIIKPIIEDHCLSCHADTAESGLVNLSTLTGLHEVAQVDTGQSFRTLVKLSHIHLFGIGLLLLTVGLIFRFAKLPGWMKNTLILLPFLGIVADITTWFATKFAPLFAYTVIIAGAVIGLALAAQILISLFQMWLYKPRS